MTICGVKLLVMRPSRAASQRAPSISPCRPALQQPDAGQPYAERAYPAEQYAAEPAPAAAGDVTRA